MIGVGDSGCRKLAKTRDVIYERPLTVKPNVLKQMKKNHHEKESS